ncbi:MAG: hypothetical protein IJV15_08335 [Lachnospiraceae bacterium]|nr:hypothetical protein [Lachnospiraceae bacterium]
MASNFYGVSASSQTNQTWRKSNSKTESASSARTSSAKAASSDASGKASDISDVDTKAWSPISESSSLVPKYTEGYGNTIGDVQLSDKAKEYYKQLKSKFGNSDFILVSGDMKSQVKQNAAAYGNANKMVVLIDEEKLEMMANDESFRKKYEGIIAMAQSQMANAANSLASSGASVKNFGMSVDSKGNTSFFATLDKTNEAQAKVAEKRAKAKAEQKVKDKKEAKKAAEAKLEETRKKRRAESDKISGEDEEEAIPSEDKEYVKIEANSLDELIGKVQKFAYANSSRSVMTEAERNVGQHFDFRG